MFNDLSRRFAAAACAAVMSATCVLAAVGPAQAGPARHAAPIMVAA